MKRIGLLIVLTVMSFSGALQAIDGGGATGNPAALSLEPESVQGGKSGGETPAPLREMVVRLITVNYVFGPYGFAGLDRHKLRLIHKNENEYTLERLTRTEAEGAFNNGRIVSRQNLTFILTAEDSADLVTEVRIINPAGENVLENFYRCDSDGVSEDAPDASLTGVFDRYCASFQNQQELDMNPSEDVVVESGFVLGDYTLTIDYDDGSSRRSVLRISDVLRR